MPYHAGISATQNFSVQTLNDTMTIDLCYPVRYCHFCNNIMFYNRYSNGEHYAYCNSPAHLGCMGFSYSKKNDFIDIKQFTVSDTEVLYFKVFRESTTSYSSSLLMRQADGAPRRIDNLLDVDINTILDKDNSIKLLKSIHKTMLLLE